MIALLLDQGLAPGAAALLRERGFDAIHVIEIGLDQADDSDILAAARLQNRACVTLDHDFHAHLAIWSRPPLCDAAPYRGAGYLGAS